MTDRLRRALLRVATTPVRLYQLLVSPALPQRCKYEPSCSSYAISALSSFGILRGSVLAVWRLLRCNPLSHGGYDPVEAQTLFRRARKRVDAPMTRTTEREHDYPGAPV